MLGGLVARLPGYLPPDTRIVGSPGGFVGGGFATAVGAAMSGSPAPVLYLLGDQGCTNGVQALAAAGEIDVPVVALVCNNGSSVSLRKQAFLLARVGLPRPPAHRRAPRRGRSRPRRD
ncbi:MAG: thiamine pyrophosphate-dependent enzyme [Haloechinothrix sp.]